MSWLEKSAQPVKVWKHCHRYDQHSQEQLQPQQGIQVATGDGI